MPGGSRVHILPFKEQLILGDKLKEINCSFVSHKGSTRLANILL